jgi:hypothetical protein
MPSPQPRQKVISPFTVTVLISAAILLPLLVMGFFFQ